MIRIMKRGALVIDLRINQGGCFETTCCLCPSDPAVFEQYGVLHYCRQNISNRVARTTSMALSNIFVPMLFLLGDAGAVQGMIKSDPGFKVSLLTATFPIDSVYHRIISIYTSLRFNP